MKSGAPAGPVSVGLHPWHIHHDDKLAELRPLLARAAADPAVVALGETGLDKVIHTSMALQEDVFLTHVDISEESGIPLIIHCVRAFQEIVRIRTRNSVSQPWILHGFNSSPEMAGELVSHGFYISVGERLLRNRGKCQAILEQVGLSAIFAETDDDDLPIEEVYRQLAEMAGWDLKAVKEGIWNNFKTVFGP